MTTVLQVIKIIVGLVIIIYCLYSLFKSWFQPKSEMEIMFKKIAKGIKNKSI